MDYKHGLIQKLQGGDGNPLGMPGTPQNPNTGIGGAQVAQLAAPAFLPSAEPTQEKPTPAPSFNTRLMEGDAGKLANVDHAKKSPKYDFLQLAQQNKYGYDDLGGMLKELQSGPNAQHWQGWTADKDKLRFGGDPSQLGSQWGGVTTVDTIGGFNSGNPQGFRWGADDGGQQAPQRPQGGGMSMLAPALGQAGRGSDNVQAALQQFGQAQDGNFLQQLIAQLQGGQS